MERSPALEERINKYAKKLERYDSRINNCNVVVAAPHRHNNQGHRYHIRLRISVPGEVIIVSHDNESDPLHEDAHIAVRDAFHNARRQLQDHVRIHRHMTKHHSPDPKKEFKARLGDDYSDEA